MKYEDYSDDFDDEEIDNLNKTLSVLFSTGRNARTELYKNYNLLKKTNLIKTNKCDDLLFAQLNPIQNKASNIVVTLKNAFNKVIAEITEFELMMTKAQNGKLIIPQGSRNKGLELKLLILTNLLDKS